MEANSLKISEKPFFFFLMKELKFLIIIKERKEETKRDKKPKGRHFSRQQHQSSFTGSKSQRTQIQLLKMYVSRKPPSPFMISSTVYSWLGVAGVK